MIDIKKEDGWSLKGSGDNGVDLMGIIIPVKNLHQAAQVATQLADIAATYTYDSNEDTQITLRTWQVEVIVATATKKWTSDGQKRFALAVSDFKQREKNGYISKQ